MDGWQAPGPGHEARVEGLPAETWIDVCLSDIHAAIEASLPRLGGPGTEARELLEGILGYTPPPELLETLKLVAEAPERSALRMGLGRMLIALAILVRKELGALTEPRRLDREMLRRQSEAFPVLVRRVQAMESDIQAMGLEGSGEADRLRRLRVTLIPPMSRLRGFSVVVARVRDLAEEAAAGALRGAEGLSQAEVAWFEAAAGDGTPGGRLVPRALLDAVALRRGLAEDLEAHWRGEPAGDRLRLGAAACDLVMERLDAGIGAARADGQSGLERRLSTARGQLGPLHRKVAAILRGGGGPRLRGEARRSLLSRPLVLAAVAGLLVVAGAVALGLRRGAAGPATASAGSSPPAGRPDFAGELELTDLERQGAVLVARVSPLSWRRATPEQRQESVYGLGVMAFGQGTPEVRIVDGSGNELASWARNGSIEILSP